MSRNTSDNQLDCIVRAALVVDAIASRCCGGAIVSSVRTNRARPTRRISILACTDRTTGAVPSLLLTGVSVVTSNLLITTMPGDEGL